jgi:hypothetical protein
MGGILKGKIIVQKCPLFLRCSYYFNMIKFEDVNQLKCHKWAVLIGLSESPSLIPLIPSEIFWKNN